MNHQSRVHAPIWPAVVSLGILLGVILAAGCVSAGYQSRQTTTTKPDGTVVVENWRSASYIDATEGGQKAFDFVAGEGGLLSALGPVGQLAGGGGILGVLGLAGRWYAGQRAERARREGEEKGWAEAERTYSPPPPSPRGTP